MTVGFFSFLPSLPMTTGFLSSLGRLTFTSAPVHVRQMSKKDVLQTRRKKSLQWVCLGRCCLLSHQKFLSFPQKSILIFKIITTEVLMCKGIWLKAKKEIQSEKETRMHRGLWARQVVAATCPAKISIEWLENIIETSHSGDVLFSLVNKCS